VGVRYEIGSVRRAWDVALAGLELWESERDGKPSVIHASALDPERAKRWIAAARDGQRNMRAATEGSLDAGQIDWLVDHAAARRSTTL
jgi:hypothetical protein